MFKNKSTLTLAAALMAGLGVGIAGLASAQTAAVVATPNSTSSVSASTSTDLPEAGDTADSSSSATKTSHHAPLGGDGVVSAINGTTITMSEESDEGAASYTVDASKATITGTAGASATLADIKVGDKIFVQGTVNGTSVAATSISLGHPGWHNDGNEGAETSEPAGQTDQGNQ
jgi:hypothetical protein